MDILKSFLISFFCVIFITPMAIKFSKNKGIVYSPRQDTMNKSAIPLLGGVAIFVSVLASILLKAFLVERAVVVLLSAFIVFTVGLIDDIKKKGSSSCFRFFAHSLAATIILSAKINFNFFQNQPVNYIISFLWIVGLTNAFNMLDGLDGLCSGIAFANATSLLFMGLFFGQAAVVFLSVAITGASGGYLFYNFYPARVYLGSSGSTFLGFILSIISILAQKEIGNLSSLPAFLLIFSIPIFDMCMTTYVRLKNGHVRSIKQWFDYKGKDHIHYRLLNKGLEVKAVVIFFYVIALLLGLVGLLYAIGIK